MRFLKSSAADGTQALRQGQGVHIGAAEGAAADGGQPLRQCHRAQTAVGHKAAILKRAAPNGGDALGDGHGGNALQTGKGIAADGGHALLHHHLFDVVGIGAPRCAVVRSVLAVVRHGAGAGDGQNAVGIQLPAGTVAALAAGHQSGPGGVCNGDHITEGAGLAVAVQCADLVVVGSAVRQDGAVGVTVGGDGGELGEIAVLAGSAIDLIPGRIRHGRPGQGGIALIVKAGSDGGCGQRCGGVIGEGHLFAEGAHSAA